MSTIPRSRNVVKVSFQKNSLSGSNTNTATVANNAFEKVENHSEEAFSSLNAKNLVGAVKKLRPNMHPSLSSDSLSSINDNSERTASHDPEDETPVRKLKNPSLIRPPKLKQLKNIQKLLLQYQQQFYHLKQQKLAESRGNSPVPNGIAGINKSAVESSWSTPFLFLIDAVWLRRWVTYVTMVSSEGNHSSYPGEDELTEDHSPGPITNWNVIDDSSEKGIEYPLQLWKKQSPSIQSKEYLSSHYPLKPDIQEGQDYYLIPIEAWNAFYNWYTGGPPLPRFLFNALQIYYCDDYYPLSPALMELLFVSPEGLLEKKVLTANEIVTLTKEKILEYYYQEESEKSALNTSPGKKIQGITDERKLIQADLYPPNIEDIPSVKDIYDYLSVTVKEDVAGEVKNTTHSAPLSPLRFPPIPHISTHHNGTAVGDKKFPVVHTFEAIPEEEFKSCENSPMHANSKTLPKPPATSVNSSISPPQPPPVTVTISEKETPMKALPEKTITYCAVCGDISKSRCSQCSLLFYCSKECQKIHWKYHKHSCKTIKEKIGSILTNNHQNISSLSPNQQVLLYGKRGKVGLQNLGNSCYMNSSLQCLLHIVPLVKYFISGKYLNEINSTNKDGTKGELAKVIAQLIQDSYLDAKTMIAPSGVKSMLGKINEEYAGFQQQDAHEVIELLLDKLHEDVNRVLNKPYTLKLEGDGSNDIMIARDTWNRHLQRHSSYIQELFGSLMRSQLTCPTCGKISVSYEYHNTIQVAIPRNYLITITIVFIPEIPSSKTTSPDGEVEFTLHEISSKWQDFLPKKLTLTVDRYTSIKTLKKQMIKQLTPFQQKFYSENGIYCFESINPSKKINNHLKMIKYCKDTILINTLSPNTILLAYGISLPLIEKAQSFLFVHLRTLDMESGSKNTQKLNDDLDDLVIHYTGYPLLLGYDATWSCHRLRYHIWLNTIRFFQESSSFVKESLHYLATANIVKQMEQSQFFSIRLIGNDGGPALSANHKKLLARPQHFKGSHMPPPIDDLDIDLGSILPSDKALTIEDFTGDISRFYPSGAIYFSLDVLMVETMKPVQIDYAHFKSLDAVVTTRSANNASTPRAVSSPSAASSSAANNNSNNHREMNPNILSLDDCLKEYTKEEILEAGNEWYCNLCKEHKQAYKIMNFSYHYLPKILILTLKRFEYRDISSIVGMNNNLIHREKIDNFIDFPINGFNVKKYCGLSSSSMMMAEEKKNNKKLQEEAETAAANGPAGGGGGGGTGISPRARKPSVDLHRELSSEVQKEVIRNHETDNEMEKMERTKSSSDRKEGEGENGEDVNNDEDEEENDAIYDLFAICNHYGRMGFGHYTAYVKDWPLYEEISNKAIPSSPSSAEEIKNRLNKDPSASSPPQQPPTSNHSWYFYDDNSVVKVANEREIKTSSAYILFYRKRNIQS